MLYRFPPGTTAIAITDYHPPYPDPIALRAGDPVEPDHHITGETDFMGWTWCRGPDGREGWVPDAWIDTHSHGWTIRRDFNAMELAVRMGDRVTLELSESGFVYARTSAGQAGWLPDAVLRLAE